MSDQKGKAPALSYADALRRGLPAPNQNNRPKSPGECSSTASSKNDADTTHATQGSAGSRSSEPSRSGNSTDSSDKPLAASRSPQTCRPLPNNPTQPSQSSQAHQPRSNPARQPVLFLRGVVADCGCLYIVDTGISGHPSRRDLLQSGFPVRGRCPLCHILVTEIRFNEDGEAEVTEVVIQQWAEEEQDGYSEEDVVEEIYIDEDVDDYDESGEEASQS